jgi:hypothetical protein
MEAKTAPNRVYRKPQKPEKATSFSVQNSIFETWGKMKTKHFFVYRSVFDQFLI